MDFGPHNGRWYGFELHERVAGSQRPF